MKKAKISFFLFNIGAKVLLNLNLRKSLYFLVIAGLGLSLDNNPSNDQTSLLNKNYSHTLRYVKQSYLIDILKCQKQNLLVYLIKFERSQNWESLLNLK
ncbi:MAG: hypothetical protein IGR93_04850 [Hydrococcus sp. C42_A2020_068]|uniref:hypothetical protein n=1 Tax=Pleurocapsa sp. PCC 7327 TaxID=118163 RepID=UPI00059ED3A7|nr:hypothetical protein [Pleurocapsa sp. PCC 7327]MBF2019448.1 hypothetical protein [Hydrococcus sp. C42_A2020_068]